LWISDFGFNIIDGNPTHASWALFALMFDNPISLSALWTEKSVNPKLQIQN
jgi:hypothetical protein